MKKTYAAPMIIKHGTAVRETMSVNTSGPENQSLFSLSVGSLGFHL